MTKTYKEKLLDAGLGTMGAEYLANTGNHGSNIVTANINNLTGGISLSAVGSQLVNNPSKNYIACIPGRQFVTSGVPKDLSDNASDGVFGASLTDANLWATAGYMTTAALANGGVYLPLVKSTFNLLTESVIFSVLLKKAAPALSESLFGNADTAASQGFYLSARGTTGKIRPVFNASGGTITGLTDSVAVFCDGTDHVLTFAYDAVTKQAFLWRDGCLSDTYTTALSGSTVANVGFFMGASAGGTAFAAQFSGVHFLKFTGGLPLNINRIAAKLASKPFDYLTAMDIQND